MQCLLTRLREPVLIRKTTIFTTLKTTCLILCRIHLWGWNSSDTSRQRLLGLSCGVWHWDTGRVLLVGAFELHQSDLFVHNPQGWRGRRSRMDSRGLTSTWPSLRRPLFMLTIDIFSFGKGCVGILVSKALILILFTSSLVSANHNILV